MTPEPPARHALGTWGPVAGAAAGALVLVSGIVASGGDEVGSVEQSVFEAINGLPDALNPIMYVLQLAGVLVVGPLVAVGALLLHRRRLALAVALVTVGKLVAERLVKQVVERERPATSIDGPVERRGDVPEAGLSYTSGHVILTVGLATVVTPWLPRRWRWVPWSIVAGNAVARIYVGAHNPLDVVGGACVGLLLGALVNMAVGTPDHSAEPSEVPAT